MKKIAKFNAVIVLGMSLFVVMPVNAQMQATETKLTASDAAADDRLGYSTSISGDTIVVGAAGDDDAGESSGSAYIFRRDEGGPDNWGEVIKLTASDSAEGDAFDYSVSISGDTIVVGASRDDDAGSDSNSGSAYIFQRDEGGPDNWGEITKLTASDATFWDRFGCSVSISGDTIVCGAYVDDDVGWGSGSAYIFQRDEGGPDNWGEVTKLTASDAGVGDNFGYSVSISGDTVVVGALNDDDIGSNSDSGSAYIFQRDEGGPDNWDEVTKLTASDADFYDHFGISVSISGDTVVCGAWADDDAGEFSGSAYVFVESGTTWTQQAKLTASDAAKSDFFGRSVSISGDTIIVGAYYDLTPSGMSGSAYIFQRDEGGPDSWGEVTKLIASDANAGDNFGTSVSISGNTVVVGAHHDDDAGSKSGSAYVYELELESDWWALDPFIIDDDGGGDYTWAQAVLQPWCSGSGTWNDPYIIEKVTIDGNGLAYCIGIQDSNVYFIIRGCMLYNSGVDHAGLILNNVINGRLINNNCSDNGGNGIFLVSSHNMSITMNVLSRNSVNGIGLKSSHNNTVADNDCTENTGYGISLVYSHVIFAHDNRIIGNNCTGNFYGGIGMAKSTNNTVLENDCARNSANGIWLGSSSNNNTILGNIFTGNSYNGIYIGNSDNTTVTENDCTENGGGITLSNSGNTTVTENDCTGNTDNGIMLAYSHDSRVTRNNCTGNGGNGIGIAHSYNNTILKNNCTGNSAHGIWFGSSSNNNTILGNIFTGNSHSGIHIDNSDNTMVTENNCTGNSYNGIEFYKSDNNTVTGNNCSGNTGVGIVLNFSPNNTVSGNNCTGNTWSGIVLNFSPNNTVSGNNCTGSRNWADGIWIGYSNNTTVTGNDCTGNGGEGIHLVFSNNNTVTGNDCTENAANGIGLNFSPNNTVSGNNCTENAGNGILLYSSHNNSVTRNLISSNWVDGIGLHYSHNNTLLENL